MSFDAACFGEALGDPLQGPLEPALRLAWTVGSRVCTRLGAVAGPPTRAEL